MIQHANLGNIYISKITPQNNQQLKILLVVAGVSSSTDGHIWPILNFDFESKNVPK